MGFLGTILNIGATFATGGASAIWRYAALAFMLVAGSKGQSGPRLSDLTIALDGEGQELPRGWGRWRQELRLVYTSGLIETKKSKGGGLFSFLTPKVTTYTYGTKCVCIGGRGPITRLRRLKLNQYPIYDFNGGAEQGGSLVWNGSFWAGEMRLKKDKVGIKIRVYPGTLSQPVDAMLVAAKGAGNWTNYPHQWLVALEIPNLEKYGNGQPRISVEMEYSVTALSDIILEIGGWVGLSAQDFDLSALAGLSVAPNDGEGFQVDSRRKAADIIGELMDIYHFSLPEVDGVLRAVLRPSGFVATLPENSLRVRAGYEAGEVADAPLRESDEENLPAVREFISRDPAREYAPGYRYARRFDALTQRKVSTQSSASMNGARASSVARVLSAEEWAASGGRTVSLGLEYLWLSAADEAHVETPDGFQSMVIDQLKTPLFGPFDTQFMDFDPLVYGLPVRDETAGLPSRTPVEPGSPLIFAAPCAFVAGSGFWLTQSAFVVGVRRSIADLDWDGADINVDSKEPGGEWKQDYDVDYDEEATIGELTAPWTPSSPEAGFTSNGFAARVWGQPLSSTTRDLASGGANLMLFDNGVAVVVETLAQTAADADSRFYSATSLQSGVFGTDDFLGALPAGARFLLLNGADGRAVEGPRWTTPPPLRVAGTLVRIRVAEREGSGQEVTWDLGEFKGENLRPPSPVVEMAIRGADGSLRLKGRARSRFYENNFALDTGLHRFEEPQFGGQYKFQLTLSAGGSSASLEKLTDGAGGAFDWAFTSAELGALLGAGGAISGTLALYGQNGVGRARSFLETTL
ncbi:MAG: phage tail protein [Armatimonadetes bacterium]|nr:phage tail protein [Armatimonadota bacterium]